MKGFIKHWTVLLMAGLGCFSSTESYATQTCEIGINENFTKDNVISLSRKSKISTNSREEADAYQKRNCRRVENQTAVIKESARNSDEEAPDTVTVVMRYEGSQRSARFGIYNAEGTVNIMKFGKDNQLQLDIPVGIYDMYCVGTVGEYIVHEDVEVKENGEFLFSESELTETILPYALLRNGEEMSVPICRRLDHEPWVEWDYSDGANSDYYNFMYYLAKVGMPPIANGIAYADSYPEGGNKLLTQFRTSKLSDKFHLTFTWFIQTTEGDIEISSGDYTNLGSGEYPSYSQNFVKYDVPAYAETPIRLTEGVQDKNISVSARMWMNNEKIGGGGLYMENTRPNVFVATGPVVDDAFDLKTVVITEGVQLDKEMTYDYDLGDGETMEFSQKERRCISSLPAVYIDGQWQYINQNHEECLDWSFQDCGNFRPAPLYPGVEAYSFPADQLTQPLGNSAPILVVAPKGYTLKSDETKSKWLFVQPQAYIGRYGEVRLCDFWMMNSKMKRDGEVLYDTDCFYNLDNWSYRNLSDGHTKGIFEAEYTNTNVLVDGEIPGYNKTYICVDERNQEDLCVPNIQMLAFKNKDGVIIDRFSSPSDGVIEFSAGDFNWETEETYYTCAEVNVKVEYSPYQKEDFAEVEVDEIPENYYMPGFGYFYRGSLENVYKDSENGWYDIRFTLTDTAGNKMIQTLSPAFYVERQSGLVSPANEENTLIIGENEVKINGNSPAIISLYGVDGTLLSSTFGTTLPLNDLSGIGIIKVTLANGETLTAKVVK